MGDQWSKSSCQVKAGVTTWAEAMLSRMLLFYSLDVEKGDVT